MSQVGPSFAARATTLCVGLTLFILPLFAVAGSIQVKCGGSKEDTCYYTFFIATGLHSFTLRGGQVYEYAGVQVGDQFCQSMKGPNNPKTCRRGTITLVAN